MISWLKNLGLSDTKKYNEAVIVPDDVLHPLQNFSPAQAYEYLFGVDADESPFVWVNSHPSTYQKCAGTFMRQNSTVSNGVPGVIAIG